MTTNPVSFPAAVPLICCSPNCPLGGEVRTSFLMALGASSLAILSPAQWTVCFLGSSQAQTDSRRTLDSQLAKAFYSWGHVRCVTGQAIAKNNTKHGMERQQEKRGEVRLPHWEQVSPFSSSQAWHHATWHPWTLGAWLRGLPHKRPDATHSLSHTEDSSSEERKFPNYEISTILGQWIINFIQSSFVIPCVIRGFSHLDKEYLDSKHTAPPNNQLVLSQITLTSGLSFHLLAKDFAICS